ncbi:hypothetical protein QBC46DRAFT_126381 [Diplogelasinospora grovesii]|uniref:Uncharacterized protein n=1 Tax=Diplogelasinospora grovesii TaxID=303347 RepID=A0AAN6S4P1_9PEZI|nr:hypothetical protein QBC46DRAFT_126381 [Diplogelasinospora grovesii]
MPEKTPNHVHGSSTSQSMTDKSPDSDVSPLTPMRADYFSVKSASPTPADRPCKVTFAAGGRDGDRGSSTSPGVSPGNSASSLGEGTATVGSSSRRASSNGSERPHTMSRKSSAASVSFRPPRNPSLPQGLPRKTDSKRLRESSPSPVT